MTTSLIRAPLLAVVLTCCLPLPALAELMLNPTRVVMARNQRAAQVELINNGTQAASYRISVVNRRMSETGDFANIVEPADGERFADAMLTYSPRQITLQPGTAQVVRLMVRKPEGLLDGEYRSHLHFEKLPEPGELASSVEPGDTGAARIGVVLKTLIGASIPVIVRHGATSATASLSQLALHTEDGARAPVLGFRILRKGNSSVYGDLTATFTPQGGPALTLAQARGVAVYAPNPMRIASLPLSTPQSPPVVLARGVLRLTYREPVESGGAVLAEAELSLP